MTRWHCALLLTLVLTGPAGAVQPGEELADPALEARARALSREIRCLVCQNQSIEDSEADLAKDLRLILRERIAAGAEDAEVKSYLVQRYGDFILLKPPVKPATWPLWFGPAAILALALCGGWLYLRRRSALIEAPPLSPTERADLDRLLAGGDGEGRQDQ
ncbi:MAG TPA: cytochrome c-type biogenesis protein [Alphaproteobacteria bacterium]|nr:cytochrome c-type biogenesis protein [Alphaproteobacteria bacterium]